MFYDTSSLETKDKNSKLLFFRAWKRMYRMLCFKQKNMWSCRRGGYCRRFVGNPLKHLWGAVSFSFNSDLFQTHTAKKKKHRRNTKETKRLPSKQKVSHNQSARSTAAPSNTWFGWTLLTCEVVDFCWRIPGCLSHTQISRMKSCREMQNNLEHQKPTHTQWYSVSKAIVPLFVLTFSIG